MGSLSPQNNTRTSYGSTLGTTSYAFNAYICKYIKKLLYGENTLKHKVTRLYGCIACRTLSIRHKSILIAET